jgi:hypothetical protein
LFEPGNDEELALAMERLWSREKDGDGRCLSERISGEAKKRARMAHDGENNYLRLLEIYSMIGEEE